ncbi:hypothetical protein ACB092_02G157200 [Castanea dentata]
MQDSSPVQDSSSSSKRICVDFNLKNLPSDPGLQQKISSYHPNKHDEIRRHYLTKGPCKLVHDFPVSNFFGKPRCGIFFYCYLFGQDVGKQGGGETFVTKGFKLWNQLVKLDSRVGGVNSAHNQVIKKSEDLLKEKQHIQSILVKQSNQDKFEYRVQLNAIVDCIRFLLCQGLTFHGHDESQGSNIVNAIARETSEVIIKDLDNGFFSILVDESRDILVKEQMTIVLRYVNKKGIIIERFLGVVHVASATALSLKYAIKCLLCEHNLSLSNLRGQGYDGASNMQGDINGLKTLIMKENKSTFYDIVNVMDFVKVSKQRLQVIRDDEWKSLLTEVSSFCTTHDISILNMDEIIVVSGRLRRNTQQNTNLHHYRVKLFYIVINMQLQELNNRFSKANNDLLLCMACLNPSNSFVAFDKEKLIRLAKELAKKLASTSKHETYPLVYLLVKLALTFPVATATVEISFSSMKYIKNELRNRMGDQWMNDYLVVYIEKNVACSIDNETIMQRFQNMKTRRRQL